MINSCAAIVIAAKHGELSKVKDASGIAHTVGTLRCKFEFRTNDWDYTTRTAVFCKGNMATRPEIIDTAIGVLLDNVDECAVPSEVLLPTEKYFSVGVWGVTQEGLRIVSKWLVFRIEDGCYVDSSESIPPTPTVYEQIIAEIGSKAPREHNHDDKYYSQEYIDDRLKNVASGIDIPTKVSQLDNDVGYLTEYTEIDPTVPAWAKNATKPTYTASEVGADPKGSATNALTGAKQYTDDKLKAIPTKVSQLANDAKYLSAIPNEYVTENELNSKGYLTEHQSLEDYAKKTDIPNLSGLESKVAKLEKDKLDESNLGQAVDVALAQAKASGEFDGKDGTSPIVSLTEIDNGYSMNITDVNGSKAIEIVNGKPGDDGTSVTHQWNGTILSVTSASGTSSADLKGAPGKDAVTEQTYNPASTNAQSGKAVAEAIENKVDKESGKSLSTNDFTDEHKDMIEEFQFNLGDLSNLKTDVTDNLVGALNELYDLKVDTIYGKGLSSNDFSDEYVEMLEENNVHIGTMTNLKTDNTDSIVDAINEIYDTKISHSDVVHSWENMTNSTTQVPSVAFMDIVTNELVELGFEDRKDTQISDEPSDDYFPTAKAVADYVNSRTRSKTLDAITDALQVNTEYYLGRVPSLHLSFPTSAKKGDVVYINFETGMDEVSLSVDLTNTTTEFDLIPAPNTGYEIFGKYNGSIWIINYSEYTVSEG